MKKKYNILIIDDDRFLLDMYSVKFKEHGFDVTAVSAGDQALEKLREGFSPDVILLDIVMPGVDGFEVLSVLQKEKLGNDPVVIILSNQGQEPEIDKAKNMGAAGYIVKASATPSEVLTKVMSIIEGQSAGT